MKMLQCAICKKEREFKDDEEWPEGWANIQSCWDADLSPVPPVPSEVPRIVPPQPVGMTLSMWVCSAACASKLSRMDDITIGVLWPEDATPEQEAAVRAHEKTLLAKERSPHFDGLIHGKIFAQREERYDAKQKRRGVS